MQRVALVLSLLAVGCVGPTLGRGQVVIPFTYDIPLEPERWNQVQDAPARYGSFTRVSDEGALPHFVVQVDAYPPQGDYHEDFLARIKPGARSLRAHLDETLDTDWQQLRQVTGAGIRLREVGVARVEVVIRESEGSDHESSGWGGTRRVSDRTGTAFVLTAWRHGVYWTEYIYALVIIDEEDVTECFIFGQGATFCGGEYPEHQSSYRIPELP